MAQRCTTIHERIAGLPGSVILEGFEISHCFHWHMGVPLIPQVFANVIAARVIKEERSPWQFARLCGGIFTNAGIPSGSSTGSGSYVIFRLVVFGPTNRCQAIYMA